MIKSIYRNIQFTLLLMCVLIAFPSLLAAQDIMFEPAAVVNLHRPKMISKNEVKETYEEYAALQRQQNQRVTETEADILDILIENELLIQGAQRASVSVSDNEVQAVYNEQKASVAAQIGSKLTDSDFNSILMNYYSRSAEEFKEEIRRKLLVEKFVRSEKKDVLNSVSAPSQKEVERFYKENASSFANPEYIHIKHIFISRESATSQEAYSKLENTRKQIVFGSKTFDEMALEVSEDQSTKFSGGELGWLAINDKNNKSLLGEDFFDNVFSLQEGTVSNVIESNAGYHLVLVTEKIEPRLLKLYDPVAPDQKTTVYQYISRNLYVQKQSQAYDRALSELIKELRDEADIEIMMEFN